MLYKCHITGKKVGKKTKTLRLHIPKFTLEQIMNLPLFFIYYSFLFKDLDIQPITSDHFINLFLFKLLSRGVVEDKRKIKTDSVTILY